MGKFENCPDSKVHVANMGPTWVLSDPDGPHVGPMNLAIRMDANKSNQVTVPLWWTYSVVHINLKYRRIHQLI